MSWYVVVATATTTTTVYFSAILGAMDSRWFICVKGSRITHQYKSTPGDVGSGIHGDVVGVLLLLWHCVVKGVCVTCTLFVQRAQKAQQKPQKTVVGVDLIQLDILEREKN